MLKKFRLSQKSSKILVGVLLVSNLYGFTETFATQSSEITNLSGSTMGHVVLTNSTRQVHKDSSAINRRYLAEYFGIKEIPDKISWKFLSDSIYKVSGKELKFIQKQGDVTFLDAVKAGVIGAHFEELALTYSKEKVATTLKDKGLVLKIESEYAPYIACAIDTGLIPEEMVIASDINSVINKDKLADLLMTVANANGMARNFIGYTNEADIYGRLINAREQFVIFKNEKLEKIGEQAVIEKVSTGYNLKSSNYDANFISELTLRYGHSTTTHASQLLGLLDREGIVAKVQLEPKTSIFQYLPEWGDVPEATPNYRVQKINEDLMLAYSLEYDMVLEFENEKDKLAFHKIVETYAKKNEGNKEGKGLLFDSWWQPLYVSQVEMKEGYKQIYDNIITDGIYSLHPFTLPANKESSIEGFKKIDPTVKINQVPIWCNDAFFRYLKGEHQ